MTSQFKNSSNTDTGYIQLPAGTTAQRPGYTVIQWTNTGTQAYSVLAGATPTLTATTWTAPTGVNYVEVLVVGGGGGGNGGSSSSYNGGGGAGGLIYKQAFSVTPSTQYTVTVGAGGASGANGSNSVFGSLTAYGGGYGGLNGGTTSTTNGTGTCYGAQGGSNGGSAYGEGYSRYNQQMTSTTAGQGSPGCLLYTSPSPRDQA